jgi:hypothetical protein
MNNQLVDSISVHVMGIPTAQFFISFTATKTTYAGNISAWGAAGGD